MAVAHALLWCRSGSTISEAVEHGKCATASHHMTLLGGQHHMATHHDTSWRRPVEIWSGGIRRRATYAHILRVEAALGRRLRGSECVYHSTPTALVLCPDRRYLYRLRRLARQQREGPMPFNVNAGVRYVSAGRHKREHVEIAEQALGHALPPGAEVHHVNEVRGDNRHANLVICQDHAYHKFLHVRARVRRLGGNPNTQRTCADCKQLRLITDMATARGDRKKNQCKACAAARASLTYHERAT